jgi:hypothetical protein
VVCVICCRRVGPRRAAEVRHVHLPCVHDSQTPEEVSWESHHTVWFVAPRLVLPATLTKEERALWHKAAEQQGLASESRASPSLPC